MEGQQVEEGQCHQVGVREQLTRDSLHSTGSGGGGKELVTRMGSSVPTANFQVQTTITVVQLQMQVMPSFHSDVKT